MIQYSYNFKGIQNIPLKTLLKIKVFKGWTTFLKDSTPERKVTYFRTVSNPKTPKK